MDSLTRKDRAQEAESLLGHRIFGEAMLQLKASWHDQIDAMPLNSPQLSIIHTKIKVLEEIVGELRSIVADARFGKASDL